MSVLQPDLRNNGPYLPYWLNAIVLGSAVTMTLFLGMHKLGSDITITDPPAIVVDFLQWQEPAKTRPVPNPVKKPKTRTVKKQKPVINKTTPPPVKKTEPVSKKPVQPDETAAALEPALTDAETEPVRMETPPVQPVAKEQFEESLPVPLPVFRATSLPRIAHLADLERFYPPVKRQQGIEATVKLEVLIDRDGKPRQVTVIKSAGSEFDQAAIDAIMASSFIPANFAGRPGPVLWRIPVTFRLK